MTPAMVTARTVQVVPKDAEAVRFAAELLTKLPDRVTYVASRWLEELLEPLGYSLCDQSRVFHALAYLRQSGWITKETVYAKTGYQARRRSNAPKPREITITKKDA